MKTINTHIEEVLGEFEEKCNLREQRGGFSYLYEQEDHLAQEPIEDFLKQSLLTLHTQTLEQIRDGVENIDKYDPEYYQNDESNIELTMEKYPNGLHLRRQDVLDLLDNLKNNG